MKFTDTMALPRGRRTANNYLVIDANVARAGIQVYTGDELGRPDLKRVRVYRPEEEVFADGALATYAHKPVTFGHPKEQVSSENDKNLRVGHIGETVEDAQTPQGRFIRVPMMLTDEATIQRAEAGTNELSMGYSADIEFRDGFTPEGEAYDAVQSNIKINHLAIVSKARGGSELTLGDNNAGGIVVKTATIQRDGLSVEVPSESAQIINKILGDNETEMEKLRAENKAMKEKLAKLDGETKAKDKALKDAEAAASPEAIGKAVLARTKLVSDAKAFDAKLEIKDSMTNADIKRAVVSAYLGDAMTEMDDAAITGAYSVAIAAKPKQRGNSLTQHMSDGNMQVADGDAWADFLPAKEA